MLEATIGDTVELKCYTFDETTWTHENDEGYVEFIYWYWWAFRPRLEVKFTPYKYHRLIISDIQNNDSGRYNCYGYTRRRIIRYLLIVKGICFFVV